MGGKEPNGIYGLLTLVGTVYIIYDLIKTFKK